jgi:GT2 family glycosyltransferase
MAMRARIVYILPSYQSFEYARACILSLHMHSPFVVAVIIDDASPDWRANSDWWQGTGGPVSTYRFSTRGGLTRSWNAGMVIAQRFRPDYIVCGNNDVLFSPGWWEGLCWALEAGYGMVGPVSNAPGITAPRALQHVRTYLPDYLLSDDPVSIMQTARLLRICYAGTVAISSVNGFFMMAKARTWRDYGYSPGMVFTPLIRTLPTGKLNRTPAMTGQEDWIQEEWRRKGLKSCIVPSSFIFHYRSVSRGPKYVIGDSLRMATRLTS